MKIDFLGRIFAVLSTISWKSLLSWKSFFDSLVSAAVALTSNSSAISVRTRGGENVVERLALPRLPEAAPKGIADDEDKLLTTLFTLALVNEDTREIEAVLSVSVTTRVSRDEDKFVFNASGWITGLSSGEDVLFAVFAAIKLSSDTRKVGLVCFSSGLTTRIKGAAAADLESGFIRDSLTLGTFDDSSSSMV